jgi:hydroxymethylglutaryl-CoA lyase
LLGGLGIRQISLADTVGAATSLQIMEVVGEVVAEHDELEIGVHLHSRRDEAADRIKAAFAGGCRRFDGAIGGLGGCPFAQDALVGNLPTEALVAVLNELEVTVPGLHPLDELVAASAQIAREFDGHGKA